MTTPQNNQKPDLPESLRKARDAARGRNGAAPTGAESNEAPKKPGDTYTPEIFPVSRAKAEEKAARAVVEKTRKEQEARIGTTIEGKGIYLGPIDLADQKGRLVGEFELYAAPRDLTRWTVLGRKRLKAEFNQACRHVAGLKGFYGHNGYGHRYYDIEEDIYEALQDGRYQGEWIIPTWQMMAGYIYPNQDKKDLAGSFATVKSYGFDCFYWSCTEAKGQTSSVYSLDMKSGSLFDVSKNFPVSTRCVRLEPRS